MASSYALKRGSYANMWSEVVMSLALLIWGMSHITLSSYLAARSSVRRTGMKIFVPQPGRSQLGD